MAKCIIHVTSKTHMQEFRAPSVPVRSKSVEGELAHSSVRAYSRVFSRVLVESLPLHGGVTDPTEATLIVDMLRALETGEPGIIIVSTSHGGVGAEADFDKVMDFVAAKTSTTG